MVNFLVIFLFVLFASFLTRWTILQKKFSSVRISSALTLLVICFLEFFNIEMKLEFSSAFLGGTFVGMTDPSKLSWLGLFYASIFYTILFCYLLPFNIGFAGALGFGAAISCWLIHTFLVRVFPIRKKEYIVNTK